MFKAKYRKAACRFISQRVQTVWHFQNIAFLEWSAFNFFSLTAMVTRWDKLSFLQLRNN